MKKRSNFIADLTLFIFFTLCIIIPVSKIFAIDLSKDIKTYDEKIKKFCLQHNNSKELLFGKQDGSNWKRCYLILQAQMRFETWNLKKVNNYNLFNFRAPTCKKQWIKDYWCSPTRSRFLKFADNTNSIKFAVDRYYKYDYRKTIAQIVWWGCYYNLQSKYVCFEWFTHTKEHQNNYTKYIKNYFNKKRF